MGQINCDCVLFLRNVHRRCASAANEVAHMAPLVTNSD